MKKVAFVISHPIQYYVPILKGLTERGNIELKVFYTWGEESINKFDPGFNRIIEWDVPLLKGYSFEFLENISNEPGTHDFYGIDNPSIIDSIKNYNPDKIVVFGWSFKSHLKVLKYFKGKVPIYFRGDSHLLNDQAIFKKLARRIYLHWVYRHIDFAVSVGENNRDYYRWVGLKEDQILFAPHAIDENKFLDVDERFKKEAIKMKEDLGIPASHIVFLYAGKFEAAKNLQTLIDAKLSLRNENCSLIMVGNGPEEEELRAKSKIDKNIHFLGFMNQSKMPIVYRAGDVFVLPSISETWGLGINEAMVCGCAIIASNKVGAARDLVSENGYVFESRNNKDLAEKMNTIVQNNQLLIHFKNKSLVKIKSWSIEQLVLNFELALK